MRAPKPLPAHLYTNLALVRPSVVEIRSDAKTAAKAERDREARAKNQIDRAALLLDRLEARAPGLDAAIAELERRKKTATNRQAAIEKRVLALMGAAGLQEVAGFRRTFTRRENGTPKLVVDDESLIPAEWMRVPKPAKAQPDKLGMKKALDASPELTIAGVHLAQTVSLVRK